MVSAISHTPPPESSMQKIVFDWWMSFMWDVVLIYPTTMSGWKMMDQVERVNMIKSR
jgi:hypothetical protein